MHSQFLELLSVADTRITATVIKTTVSPSEAGPGIHVNTNCKNLTGYSVSIVWVHFVYR